MHTQAQSMPRPVVEAWFCFVVGACWMARIWGYKFPVVVVFQLNFVSKAAPLVVVVLGFVFCGGHPTFPKTAEAPFPARRHKTPQQNPASKWSRYSPGRWWRYTTQPSLWWRTTAASFQSSVAGPATWMRTLWTRIVYHSSCNNHYLTRSKR